MPGLGRRTFIATEVLTAANVNGYLMDQSVMVFAGTAARSSAIGTAVSEGMVSYLSDSDTLELYNGSSWGPVSSSSSGNAIINGAFDFWQRGTSFSAYSAGGLFYTADRWATQRDGSGATVTTSQQTFTPGAAPVAGYESQYFIRVAQSVAGTGGTYNQLLQRIEDVRTLAGQTTTVSFWAKADSATGRTMQPVFIQNFGSGGSADVLTYGTAITLSTSWARYTQTIAMPSVSGKTIGANSAVSLSFFLPLNIVQTYDIWGVQLEAGSTATPFRRNGANIQAELAACQRYYQRTGTPSSGSPYAAIATARMNSTTAANVYFPMIVPLRVAPTSVDFSTLALSVAGSSQAVTGLALLDVSTTNATFRADCSSGSYTTGQLVFLINNNSTSAFLGFSAEL
jgi:hypothetical protein